MPKPSKPPAPEPKQPALQFQSTADWIQLINTLPKVYFDQRDSSYWIKLREDGRFLQLSTRSIVQHFIRRGLSKDILPGIGWRQCDYPYLDAEEHNVVDYAGPLAGHKTGLYTENGKTYLVTDQAHGVWDELPRGGEPAFFKAFIQELLDDHQWYYFCTWLALALQSLRNGDFRPGQAVILAGPARCGKSLLQYIVTHVLGGRKADPFGYMFGSTTFNFDLIKAEHWMFEDPPTTTDIKTRRFFGEKLKECCNNEDFRAHKKNKDGESVRIFRRVTGSINNEVEHLAQVPPMEEGTKDKIFLFKCSVAAKSLEQFIVTQEQKVLPGMGEPIPIGQQDRKKLKATIHAELPVLRSWLLRSFTRVPEELIDPRMGITAWHHPELLAEINALAPEERLLQLIDSVLWDDEFPTCWEGKALDLEQDLRGRNVVSEVERLFRFANACGAYLGKLLRRHPHRISNRKKDGYTVWTILPPPKTAEQKEDNGIQEQKSAF